MQGDDHVSTDFIPYAQPSSFTCILQYLPNFMLIFFLTIVCHGKSFMETCSQFAEKTQDKKQKDCQQPYDWAVSNPFTLNIMSYSLQAQFSYG